MCRQRIDLDKGAGWRKVSKNAKDLLLKLMERDPAKRATAMDVLKHPWLAQGHKNASANIYEPEVQIRMKQFQSSNVLKKKALLVSKLCGAIWHIGTLPRDVCVCYVGISFVTFVAGS